MSIDWATLTVGIIIGWVVGSIGTALGLSLIAINREPPEWHRH